MFKRTISFIFISLLIHSLLLIVFNSARPKIEKKSNNQQEKTAEIEIVNQKPAPKVEEKIKPIEIKKELIKPRPKVKNLPKKARPKKTIVSKKIFEGIDANVDCPHGWYGGIGVTVKIIDEKNCQVIEVFPGYTAELANLQPRDYLYNPEGDIKGKPGTTINLIVLRRGQIFHLPIKRVKVCY